MADVFISYASEDRARARMLAEALETRGLSVWWDRKILAGQTYDEVIERELETAKSVVVLWSRHSIVSEWVKNEAQVAVERGRLVPALVDAVKPPLEFRRKQTADLVGWDGDVECAGFDALQRGVSAHVSRETGTQPPGAAPHEAKAPGEDAAGTVEAPSQAQTATRRQGRRALVRAGAAALAILGMTGLWLWDAFYRPHIDYFANVTKRWGLPEGIGALSAGQLRRRNVTLAFFRQGARGPVREIRAVNSRGAYPAEFAYFPPQSLLGLNPLLSDDLEILNICRVSFEYDNGRIVRQSAYDRDDRLLYALHYPQPDIAEYKWEVFSKVMRESGLTHLRFVRPGTGPDAGLDKDVLYLDSAGTPVPDRDGTYGRRRLFDGRGLAVESMPLGADAQPTANRVGIAKWKSEYDGLGNLTRDVNLGPDGRPVVGFSGSAERRMRYDQYGNNIEVAFFDASGQLVTSHRLGAAGRASAYDERGNVVENTFFGPDRQLVTGPLAFARQNIAWDEKGGSLETYFGPDGKAVLISGRAIKVKGGWDERGRVVDVAYLDENDRPVRNAQGCARTRMDRDERGHVVATACLDEADRPVRDTSGIARVERSYDPRGNTLEEIYFGPGGQSERYEERYVKTRWKYDAQGKPVEQAYFDAANKPVSTREGYARIAFGYDLHGNLREVALFDESGQPAMHKGGYARIVRAYDARGNLVEESLLDAAGKPVRAEAGYAKARFAYDARGYRIDTGYLDERDRPTANRAGCARERIKHNDKGQRTEWACFGVDGAPAVAAKYGYAKARRILDVGGRLSRVEFLDANGDRVRSAYGYARIGYSYDEFGRETKREYFDLGGEAVPTRVAIDKVEPDSKSQRLGLLPGDLIIAYDGQEVADDRRFNELELTAGERPRQLTIERAGKSLTLDVAAGRLTGIETVDKVPASGQASSSPAPLPRH